MTSSTEFTQQAPEFAEFGLTRFQSGVAYLGTLRADGSRRVHAVTLMFNRFEPMTRRL